MKAFLKKLFLNEQEKACYRKVGAFTIAICAGLLGATTQGLILPPIVKEVCIIVGCLSLAIHQVGSIDAKQRLMSK